MSDLFSWLGGVGAVMVGYSHGAGGAQLIVMALAGAGVGALIGYLIDPDP